MDRDLVKAAQDRDKRMRSRAQRPYTGVPPVELHDGLVEPD